MKTVSSYPIHPFFAGQLCVSGLTNLYHFEAFKNFYPEAYQKKFEALFKSVEDHRTEFDHAVLQESLKRFYAYLQGVRHYDFQSKALEIQETPILAQRGTVALRDYGKKYAVAPPGLPVLFIPSLVNRSYIFDLNKKRSFFAYLAQQGIRPLLVDWGEPRSEEENFSLQDYVEERLLPLLDEAFNHFHKALPVIGYCMGGLFALAGAWKRKEIPALGFLAVPWDFHQQLTPSLKFLEFLTSFWSKNKEDQRSFNPDLLKFYFFLLNPLGILKKFREFASFEESPEKAQDFAFLEHWVNDGVPLAGKVAQECFEEWYLENSLVKHKRLAGETLDFSQLKAPAFVALPERDAVVPYASARSLLEELPQEKTTVIEPSLGHVGMIVSQRAETQVWAPLTSWLKQF